MLTVLIPHGDDGRLLTKRFYRGDDGQTEFVAYSRVKHFDVMPVPVGSFVELIEALTLIEAQPDACVIRGTLIDPDRTERVTRTYTSMDANYFRDAPQQWLMIDLDEVPANGAATEAERLAELEKWLPADFQQVTYYYQWSSSMGVFGWEKLKAHLWFWLSTPTTCAFIKEKADLEGWTVDRSVFQPVQPHYIANPIFDGVPDPLADCRTGLREYDRWSVDLSPIVRKVEPKPDRPVARAGQTGGGRMAALEAKLAMIDGYDLHASVRAAACSYASMWKDEADESQIYDLLYDRIQGSSRNTARIRDEISKLNHTIKTAIRKFG